MCVDRWRGHSRCRAPLTTGVDIYPRVLPSAYCVFLAGPLPLQGALNHWDSIYPRVLPSAYCVLLAGPLPLQGALNHWGRYLPQGPTICILRASGGYHLHTACFWRGHSHCRAPLTTGVDIYPRVLPSAYCVLLAGPLPLQGALNHWGRYLPQGPTICILCASGGATPITGHP